MKVRSYSLILALVMALGLVEVRADAAAMIGQARAYLGSEEALSAIQSIRYRGRLTMTESGAGDASRTVQAQVQIIFQSPYQQRIEATGAELSEVTALDDYEAWRRVQDRGRPGAWKLSLLGKAQVKRLRANTWENLSFYRGLVEKGGQVVDHGLVDLEGRSAHKITFVHDDDIAFERYFDPETGQLWLTETEQGTRIREEGALHAGGVRFPQRVITESKSGDQQRRVVVEFDEIVVNEVFPDALFRVPTPGPLPAAP